MYKMILQRLIFTIFLLTYATHAAVLDQAPPVFTYCPSDIVIDNDPKTEVKVTWKMPEATDNSGEPPLISSNIQSGAKFRVPGTYQVLYEASDKSGNKATCSFRITLRRKTCQMYNPPENGALACYNAKGDYVCVAMCKDGYDFVFNPAYMYYCSVGQWQSYTLPSFPDSKQLPWPNCAKTANPSHGFGLSQFYFTGDAKDPNVQTVIKNNYIFLMTSAGNVPPFFCQFLPECRADNVEVFPGALTV